MARTTFTAVTPDGQTVKRTSEGRTYTHAIITNDKGTWGALGWAGSETLAAKAVATYKNRGFKTVEMVPALVASKRIDLTEAPAAEADAKPAKKPAAKAAAKPAAKPAKAAAKPTTTKVDRANTPERKAERKLVEKMRAQGASWDKIGEAIGLSKMGTRGRYADLLPVRAPRITTPYQIVRDPASGEPTVLALVVDLEDAQTMAGALAQYLPAGTIVAVLNGTELVGEFEGVRA